MSRVFEDIYATENDKNIHWRMISDQVMGGRSQGQVLQQNENGSICDCLIGNVSLENNGGFIQMQIGLDKVVNPSAKSAFLSQNFADFEGIFIEVIGNPHSYNLHFKTSQLWLPWQSFRKEIEITDNWQQLCIPFAEFKSYRTFSKFNPAKVTRFAVVAIGDAFAAKVCVRRFGVYRNQ